MSQKLWPFLSENKGRVRKPVERWEFDVDLPTVLILVVLLTPITRTVSRAWDREECSFIFVVAVARFFWPRAKTYKSHITTSKQSCLFKLILLSLTISKISSPDWHRLQIWLSQNISLEHEALPPDSSLLPSCMTGLRSTDP